MKTGTGLILGVLGCMLLLAGCGSSSGDGSSNSFDAGPGNNNLSCQQQFNPERAIAGEDCSPVYDQFCQPQGSGLTGNANIEVTPCEGVTITEGVVEAGGESSEFVLLQPTNGEISGIYVALHWALGAGPAMAERMRLAELARARNLAVIAPTAPGLTRTWGISLLVIPVSDLETRLNLVDALITEAKNQSGVVNPVFIGGVSGGANLTYSFACERSERVDGIVMVAAELAPGELDECQPTSNFATVQVHGTADVVGHYYAIPLLAAGAPETFARFQEINGCDYEQVRQATLTSDDEPLIGDIVIDFVGDCSSGVGSALVTVEQGGHTWPGLVQDFGLPFNLFGTTTESFDTSLQGFDLLRFISRR